MSKRKRLVVGLAFLSCLLLGAAVFGYAFLWEAEPGEYRAIRCGMTGEEVRAIFGREPGASIRWTDTNGEMWKVGNDVLIIVYYDLDGRVTVKRWSGPRFLDELWAAVGIEKPLRFSEEKCD